MKVKCHWIEQLSQRGDPSPSMGVSSCHFWVNIVTTGCYRDFIEKEATGAFSYRSPLFSEDDFQTGCLQC